MNFEVLIVKSIEMFPGMDTFETPTSQISLRVEIQMTTFSNGSQLMSKYIMLR